LDDDIVWELMINPPKRRKEDAIDWKCVGLWVGLILSVGMFLATFLV